MSREIIIKYDFKYEFNLQSRVIWNKMDLNLVHQSLIYDGRPDRR